MRAQSAFLAEFPLGLCPNSLHFAEADPVSLRYSF
jgi:hypothetical protein